MSVDIFAEVDICLLNVALPRHYFNELFADLKPKVTIFICYVYNYLLHLFLEPWVQKVRILYRYTVVSSTHLYTWFYFSIQFSFVIEGLKPLLSVSCCLRPSVNIQQRLETLRMPDTQSTLRVSGWWPVLRTNS